MQNFAKATGQYWKYKVWLLLTICSIIITFLFLSIWQENPLKLPIGWVVFLYFSICITWFVWWTAAIRCPNCKKRPVWYQMKHSSFSSSQGLGMNITVCPICGFKGANENH